MTVSYALVLLACFAAPPPSSKVVGAKADGYRGIWYANEPLKGEFPFKYSGGFATYPQQHVPIAVYAAAVRKTFFCYGGVADTGRSLLLMVSYFDHATGKVPRPTILIDKRTTDAHENPTLTIDDQGYLWIFCNAHGASRPAYVFRGLVPFSIEGFEHVLTTNFSYGQPWYVPGHGFLFLHTRYGNGRGLFWMTSRDGRQWSEPEPLAHVELGHYQVSWRIGTRVGTAFNYHPRPSGLNARTNLYYLETADGGASWRTAAGAPVALPLEAPYNPALVRVYRGDHRLVYLKDLEFDSEERPVILYLTSRGYVPGSQNDPRVWHTARWTGTEWDIRELTQSDHNYDHGSLYIESDGAWRVIAPTDAGAQPYGTGGGVVMWLSHDQGRNWSRVQTLTHDSHYNHTYVRKPWNAADDFYALWADGDTLHASDCHLYFTNRLGTGVWQLPPHMDSAWARPERIQ